jgi:hypothetical protein
MGTVGACLADTSQQADYDRGFADAQAGRPSNPNTVSIPTSDDLPSYYHSSDPNAEPPPQMGPWDGTTGSGPPEPPDFPEYHEPTDPYEPEEPSSEPEVVD